MSFKAEVLGGYPRSNSLRKALRRLEEKGEESTINVSRLLRETTLIIVGVQIGAGLDTIVDGFLDWHDLLRPFASAWRGVYLDGLLRWFDNNFFYRVPVFVELPDAEKFVVAPRMLSIRGAVPENYRLKAVVPGPYTFLKLSRNKTGHSDLDLMEAIATIIGREARAAYSAGAEAIQVEEPFMGDVDADPVEVEQAVEVINEKVLAGLGAETRIAVQYNPPSPGVYEKILEVKTDYIVIDFADSPKRALNLIREKGCGGRGIGVGAIQARDLVEDRYENVKSLLNEAFKCSDRVLLTSSAWFDLLPFGYALEKTRNLGFIAQRYREEKSL